MSSDLEYLLLKDKGPYHEVYVRRRLDNNPGLCKFYAAVISIITISLVLLLFCLVYVFVLVPSWQGDVLSWDGRTEQQARTHVLTHTQCGLVEGMAEEGVYVFKGIPYAQPPVGSRRWREPGRMSHELGTCWRGTFQARRFGPSCVQPPRRGFKRLDSVVGSEDCLFLNVWTQSLDPLSNRPVMFWIHGGDLLYGSGHSPPMSPTPEATKSTQAVFVSVNYRLGPFGFLALDALSRNSSSGTSGNYGLMDTVLALEWVRDNIRNFGGNPNKVTVVGQGSGATLTQALLTASHRTSGLFHRAWLASGPPVLNTTSAQASRENLALLNFAECPDAGCLRRLSAVEVMRAGPWWWKTSSRSSWGLGKEEGLGVPVAEGRRRSPHPRGGALTVVVDGHILKETPLQAWKHGRGLDVPTVFTTTAQEADLLPFDPTISSWTWQHYKATLMEQLTPSSSSSFNSSSSSSSPPSPSPSSSSSSSSFSTPSQPLAETALELYPPSPSLTPEYQYTSLVTDVCLTCPVHLLASAAAAGATSSASTRRHSPVFRGVVVASPSSPVNLLNVSSARYAFHGWDLLVFFGHFQAFGFRPSGSDLKFQKVLRQQVMGFAREGRPQAPVWEPTGAGCTALLSDHVFPAEGYERFRCKFWWGHHVVACGLVN
ncbi:neurotactin-like [Babylonia areolata]|uniref:neurotactin-like n=1 Tax=Babylonia areolata TaxID=304850 RepID=UPI003FD1F826